MFFRNTFYLPAGMVATLVGSADLAGGLYQNIKNPGETPDAAVSIAASATVNLGPFNTSRGYLLTATGGSIAQTQAPNYNPSTEPTTTFDLGTKNGSTVTATEKMGIMKHTRLTFVDTPITLTDDPGNGQYGGVKVYTFPEGLINMAGAVIAGTFTTLTGTFITTFASVVALGTVTATTGNTLTSTEANVMQSTANSAAVANAAAVLAGNTATALTESGARWLDGTTTPVPVFLNFLVTDDASHTSGTAKFTGTIDMYWFNLGDHA